MSTTALRRLLAALLVGTAALFAIGVAIEKSEDSGHDESSARSNRSVQVDAAAIGSAGHGGVPRQEEGHEEGREVDEDEESGEDEEKILGVSPESTGAVIAAVVISVLLAIGVLRWPSRALFVVVALVCLAFAVADIVEGAEKFEGSEVGIGVIASIVAIGHLAAAFISGYLATRPQEELST